MLVNIQIIKSVKGGKIEIQYQFQNDASHGADVSPK
jgi:hypothetical protein